MRIVQPPVRRDPNLDSRRFTHSALNEPIKIFVSRNTTVGVAYSCIPWRLKD
jgi:hypothetical protein